MSIIYIDWRWLNLFSIIIFAVDNNPIVLLCLQSFASILIPKQVKTYVHYVQVSWCHDTCLFSNFLQSITQGKQKTKHKHKEADIHCRLHQMHQDLQLIESPIFEIYCTETLFGAHAEKIIFYIFCTWCFLLNISQQLNICGYICMWSNLNWININSTFELMIQFHHSLMYSLL